jgi:hypothetical protein
MWWRKLVSKRLGAAIASVSALVSSGADPWTIVAGVASVACAYIAGETFRPSE